MPFLFLPNLMLMICNTASTTVAAKVTIEPTPNAVLSLRTPQSWEAIDRDTAAFTPDMTPLILAAHRDNYEILKILLDRGYTFPAPHGVRCSCVECFRSRNEDSLRHARSRINSYRALASPSLIALSSKDPILTAFELSGELRRLAFLEHEFKNEYLVSEYREFLCLCARYYTLVDPAVHAGHFLWVGDPLLRQNCDLKK